MIAEGFTMTPTTIEQVNKNNELFDQYFASHPVVTLSLEQTQAMNNIRKATEALKSSKGWKESETSILTNNAQIKRIQNAINDKTPQLENESSEQYVIRLNNLYNEDKNIIDAKREVAIQINTQNESLARINEQYKLNDPDDAETASGEKGSQLDVKTGTGINGIKVISTSSDDIEVDSDEDSEEEKEELKESEKIVEQEPEVIDPDETPKERRERQRRKAKKLKEEREQKVKERLASLLSSFNNNQERTQRSLNEYVD